MPRTEHRNRAQLEHDSREARYGRPLPDEAPVDGAGDAAQSVLPRQEWFALVKRAGKRTIDDNMPMIAQALAYSTFMAIPAVLLVALGVFSLFAGPETITTLMRHFGSVMPQQATQLLGDSLTRLSSQHGAGTTGVPAGLLRR